MNKTEKRAYNQLKKLYDRVQGPMPRTKWGQKDHFGCWDFICISEDRMAFIQVSETAPYNRGLEYRKKLEEFPRFKDAKKEYWWYRKDKKFFRVWEL